jgi:membrane protein YqaA with SNARE-associated domain
LVLDSFGRAGRTGMTFQSLTHLLGPHLATMIVAFFSGFLPFINIELYVVVAAAVVSGDFPAWTLGIAAAVGQMIAKSMLYRGGFSTAQSRLARRFTHDRIVALTERLRRMNPWALNVSIFGSAATGFPPFLLVSILAGVIRMTFWQFLLTGLVGRTVRLVAIAELSHLLKQYVP